MKLPCVFVAALLLTASGCGDGPTPLSPTIVTVAPPPGSSTSVTSSGSPGGGATVGYTEDVKLILDADCVRCHNTRTREGRVDLSSYSQVLRTLQPGNTNSVLVRVSRQGGSMFREWRGDGTAKADLIRRWVVEFQAKEAR